MQSNASLTQNTSLASQVQNISLASQMQNITLASQIQNTTLASQIQNTTLAFDNTSLVSSFNPTMTSGTPKSTISMTSLVFTIPRNDSGIPYLEELDPEYCYEYFSIPHRIIASSILITVILAALFGNTLVILAFRRTNSLRSVTNYFVVSLSIADILVATVAMPIWTYHLIIGCRYIILSPAVTDLWLFLDIACGVASITNLTLISVERYFCISRPFSYHQHVTSSKAIIVIFAICLYSLLTASCRLIIDKPEDIAVYTIAIPCTSFFLPLAIMGFSYQQIFSVAKYQMKKIEMTIHGKTKKFRLAREIRAAKVLAVVMGAFVFCWGPFLMANWYATYNIQDENLPEVVAYTKCLHYFNSCLNPIIYACLNREFKNAFRKLLGFKKRQNDRRNSNSAATRMTAEYSLTPSSDGKL